MSASPAPFPHWMLREIHDQPDTLAATLSALVDGDHFRDQPTAPLRAWINATGGEIVIVASGSSRHAGLVGELLLEDLAGIAVDVEYASEFTYRSSRTRQNAGVMVISQSGETADTLAALRKAAAEGHPTLAITNVPTSTMAREAGVSFLTAAGRELAIPATKSFTAQLMNLYLFALLAAEERGTLGPAEIAARLLELATLPARLSAQLPGWQTAVESLVPHYAHAQSFLFLGRGVHYAIAREGALKLKESAYLHAEGYPSGELKHGPNALVSEGTPLVMLATHNPSYPGSVERYDKVIHLMRDMRSQGADILAIANTGDTQAAALATHTIFVEPRSEAGLPMLEVVPLQLFAYFMAIQRGIDVDRPRNLTKAVLSE